MTGRVRFRVLVSDAIAPAGIELLRRTPGFDVTVKTGLGTGDLAALMRQHEALVVRSATRVTAELLAEPGRLKVIGRAGTGIDNIDLEAATRAGVVVINSPGGNSVAASEHTISMLLALARNIPQACAALREGRWERERHVGVEVAGKTLGVIGLGRVGREVARRALGLRMKVVGSDPYVSDKAAAEIGVTAVDMAALLEQSDFVTLHLPLTEDTSNVIDAAALGRMKPGARLVNCARGGLIDEKALRAALDSGHLSGAALDVFRDEPRPDPALVGHERVISTPHLGASTVEAQERVGTEVAEKIRAFLTTGAILDAVNFPSMSSEEYETLRPVMDLADRLGRFLGQVAGGGMSSLELRCYGQFTQLPLRPIVMAAVKGLLSPFLAEGVSYVNALALARERGIRVEEGRSSEQTPYAGLLRLDLVTDAGASTVAGALFTSEHPRLVEVDGVDVECNAAGNLLFFRNRDVPGVVGRIGTILGRAGVNIAGIQLGRARDDGEAVSIVNVDSPVPAPTLAEIQSLPEITFARTLRV